MQEENINIPEIKLDEVNDMKVVSSPESATAEIETPTPNNIYESKNSAGSTNFLSKIKAKLGLKKSGVVINNAGGNMRSRKIVKITIGILIAILLVIVILGIAIGIPGMAIYAKAKILNEDYIGIKTAVAKQNISQIKTATTKLQTDLNSFESSYNLLGWTRFLPVLGNYWSDGSHAIKGGQYGLNAAQIGIDTAAPYADIIGFTGDTTKKATSGEQNANDRITFIASTIKGVLPKIGELATQAELAKKELDQIDPNRYPVSFSGKPVVADIKKILDLADQGTLAISESKPLLEATPYLMGIDSPRTYLIIF